MALIKTDSGCKVGWETYDNEHEARMRARRAVQEAIRLASAGYDFGYSVPGVVWQGSDGNWVVVVP